MKIIDLQDVKKDFNSVKKLIIPAVKEIKNGGIVIFPTETVYGLGANCFNKEAVKKIFLAKNRPYSDPLIVHISKKSQLYDIAEEIILEVKLLIETFWPGPLSIVVKKKVTVPDIVTANRDTVCVRMPKNFVAKMFINLCKVPIAAPSANIFTRVSATHINHILKDFSKNKYIDYIIYDGRTEYGLESTILDCTQYPFKVLRYGSVTLEEIRKKTKLLVNESSFLEKEKVKVPGMFKKHYSPMKKTFLVKDIVKYVKNKSDIELQEFVIICSDRTQKYLQKKIDKKLNIISYGKDLSEIAKNLYYTLRKAEEFDVEFILVEPVEKIGVGRTIMDRLEKACVGKWIDY